MIAIDLTYMDDDMLDGKLSSGVSVFAKDIIDNIALLGHAKEYCLIINGLQVRAAKTIFPQFKKIVFRQTVFRRFKGIKQFPVVHDYDQVLFNKMVKRHGIKAVWFPFASPADYYTTSVPSVVTLHDIIPIKEDRSNFRLRSKYEKIVKNATKIITTSQYVTDDVKKEFPITDGKISHIYNSIDVDIANISEIKELENERFILDINAYQKRKNAETLLRAYSKIAHKIEEKLVFCGGYTEKDVLPNLKELAKTLGVADRVKFFCSIPIEERNWLIKNADLFVSPSLSEGFGRTPIEAAICKKTVICTKVDSLYEVTKGLLKYYDNPRDCDELARVILDSIRNPQNEGEKAKIADAFLEEYSPVKIATEYESCLREVL